MKVNWSLLENIGSLLTVKGLQYILSFITFPYLVRVLHVDGFGQLAFATGAVPYLLAMIEDLNEGSTLVLLWGLSYLS